jgi:hypothetical protein
MTKTIIYCHNKGGEPQIKEYNYTKQHALDVFNHNYWKDYIIDKVEEVDYDDKKTATQRIIDRIEWK